MPLPSLLRSQPYLITLTFNSTWLLSLMRWRNASVVHSQVIQGWKGGREANFVFLCNQGLWLLVCKLSAGTWRSQRWRRCWTRSCWGAGSSGMRKPSWLCSCRKRWLWARPKAGRAWLHAPGVCWGWHFNPRSSSPPRLPATPHPLSALWSCEWGGGCARRRARAFCSACGATPSAPAFGNTH